MSFTAMPPDEETINNQLDELQRDSQKEAERLAAELREIDLIIRQNQNEVDKLGQREASLSGQVKAMETNLDSYEKNDIRNLYNLVIEQRMRLILMRQQLEGLQTKQQLLKERQQQHAKLAQTLAQRPKYEAGRSGGRVGGVGTGDAQTMVSKIIQAQENERLRVSRQLHDGPAQAMSNLVLRAEICERWMEADMNRAKSELSGLKSMVNDTLQETRRFIFDLRPMILDDLGLLPTLRRYIKDYVEKNKIEVNFLPSGRERRLPTHVETAIFRIIQEALINVAMHANAAHVQVVLDLGDKAATITIEDDGVGFDINKLSLDLEQKSLGIASMGQRIEMLGGQLNIDSTLGRGTRVLAIIPLES
ncbi:MAG TPA: sensor histidine kinase [Chloroflexia bacterium]|nr:sensor histidine kinase [Chloroflexia bacterium]